jgi:hypothetical protein
MKNMFGGNVWSSPQNQTVGGMGFRPGPVMVNIVGNQRPGHFQLGGASRPLAFRRADQQQAPAPKMEGECSDGSCSVQPSQTPMPANRVPMGKKTDCPVCRSFGGSKGF